MNAMNFLPLDICKKLQEKINLKSFVLYNKEQIINPEIIEKHGDLTDDGYYELTKDCGGPYEFNEVYIYEYILLLKRDVFIENEMVYAYTIDCVLKWLREEKKIHLLIDIERKERVGENIKWGYWVVLLNNSPLCCVRHYDFKSDSYEDAVIAGIEYLMNNNLI